MGISTTSVPPNSKEKKDCDAVNAATKMTEQLELLLDAERSSADSSTTTVQPEANEDEKEEKILKGQILFFLKKAKTISYFKENLKEKNLHFQKIL